MSSAAVTDPPMSVGRLSVTTWSAARAPRIGVRASKSLLECILEACVGWIQMEGEMGEVECCGLKSLDLAV
jgi:hypothetical protein